MIWMLLVLLYGLLKGVRDVVKKKSMEKSTVMEVLFSYTLLGFIMVIPDFKNAMGLEPRYYFYILIKSFVIFLAWIFSFYALKKLPISLYGVLDLSRVMFATLLGVAVLGEVLSLPQTVGLLFVSSGLLLLRYRTKKLRANEEENKYEAKLVIMAFASCILNAVSGLLDKILMKHINSSQLQFWYMLFLVLMYLVYIIITRTPVRVKETFRNYWIWIMSFTFIIADRALFIANGMENSKITIMTLIKQSGCVVAILAGKFIFKEKHVGHKLVCAGIIVMGIVIGVL